MKKALLGLLEGREPYVIGKDGIVKMVRSAILYSGSHTMNEAVPSMQGNGIEASPIASIRC